MKGLVPVAMLLIGRGRPIEHPKGHFRGKGPTRADIAHLPVAHAHTPSTPFGHYGMMFHNVTSGQKGPTRADIAQIPVAHAHTQGNPQ